MKNSLRIKQKMLSSSLLALGLGMAGIAQAEDNPWYIGGSVNAADVSDIDTTSTAAVAGANRTIDIDSDDDVGFGIKIGRILHTASNGNQFSLELSYAEIDNDVDVLTFNGNPFADALVEGEIETKTTLLRGLYKFETGIVDPYIGLGIGQTDLDVDVRYGGSVGSLAGTQPPFATSGDEAFAIQYRVGAEWGVSERVGLFLEYTFTDVDDIEFSRTGGGPGGLATTTQEGDFDIESINLGVNFRF